MTSNSDALDFFMPKQLNCGRAFTLASVAVSALLMAIAGCYFLVAKTASPFLYHDIAQIPKHDVAVVLGTSRYTTEGNLNGFYRRRMEAVAELLRAGKIRYILVSGDNSSRWYDEPSRMKQDLIKLGVPESLIYRDYAGFRTLDSVIRARKVFGLQSFIIVSQKFQNERALYIARNNDIDAIAFNAHGSLVSHDYSNRVREALARVLAVAETLLLGTGPKVLGPNVVIGKTPPT